MHTGTENGPPDPGSTWTTWEEVREHILGTLRDVPVDSPIQKALSDTGLINLHGFIDLADDELKELKQALADFDDNSRYQQ